MNKYTAIIGIWIAVGMVGLKDTQGWSAVVSIMALITTFFIVIVEE